MKKKKKEKESFLNFLEVSADGTSRIMNPEEKPLKLMAKWNSTKDEKKFQVNQKILTETQNPQKQKALSKEKDDLGDLMNSLAKKATKPSPPQDDVMSTEELEVLLADLVRVKQ